MAAQLAAKLRAAFPGVAIPRRVHMTGDVSDASLSTCLAKEISYTE
jgi:hypothetical protein